MPKYNLFRALGQTLQGKRLFTPLCPDGARFVGQTLQGKRLAAQSGCLDTPPHATLFRQVGQSLSGKRLFAEDKCCPGASKGYSGSAGSGSGFSSSSSGAPARISGLCYRQFCGFASPNTLPQTLTMTITDTGGSCSCLNGVNVHLSYTPTLPTNACLTAASLSAGDGWQGSTASCSGHTIFFYVACRSGAFGIYMCCDNTTWNGPSPSGFIPTSCDPFFAGNVSLSMGITICGPCSGTLKFTMTEP